MKLSKEVVLGSVIGLSLVLNGCDQGEKESLTTPKSEKITVAKNADVLPYLNIQEQPAKIALPFCENKNCINLDIQTLDTVDPWMNQWIEKQQAKVIQDQIGLKQDMNLQQAINAYEIGRAHV